MQVFRALLILAMFAVGCGTPALHVSSSDKERTLEWPGDVLLAVELTANPSTGYRWIPKDLETSIVQVLGDSEYSQSLFAKPGSDQQQTLRFRAIREGSTTIRLEYRRSWEPDVAPIDVFEFTVETKPPFSVPSEEGSESP